MARRDLSKPLAESTFGDKPKRKVTRSKTKLKDVGKSKTKRVSKKDGTVKIKTKTKWEDGSKSKSKVEISKGGKVTTTLKRKPPKGTARKAKKAGKKSAKGAALGAMGGAASATQPIRSTASQITRRPRRKPKAISGARMPIMPPPIRRNPPKAKR